jgi:hypothetical protein
MKYSDMSDQELIELYKDYYTSIYIVECYSVKDMMILDSAGAELERRGFAINYNKIPEITKELA